MQFASKTLRLRTIQLASTLALVAGLESRASDWMTWEATYTHNPETAERVDQYAEPRQPVMRYRPDYQRSGYRNYRTTLQTGQGADNVHIVDQWGKQVVPYEHWRFPYRPFGVPYDAWGPPTPYGLFNGLGRFRPQIGPFVNNRPIPHPSHPNSGVPPMTRPAHPQPPGVSGPLTPGAPGTFPVPPQYGYGNQHGSFPYSSPNGFPLTPQYRGQPWYDGTYPTAPPLDPWTDHQFYYKPTR